VKPALLIITILFSIPAISQRVYGVEDTSNRRQFEWNLTKDAVKVFPNPVANDLYITTRMDGLQIKTVFIYDKDGNRVIEQKVQSVLSTPIKVNVSKLQQGLYYLVLETNKQPYRMQLLKQ
jgi:hypothetical protein